MGAKSGNKQFEISNHLGNVISTISDRKLAEAGIPDPQTGLSPVTVYYPQVISAQDYYAFGAPMPGRSFSEGGYRFGFNAQEKDDEIYGEGNAYTAMFWEYDARIGRRWNLDPKPQINISDYACFGNNPIGNRDILGDKIKPTNKEAKKTTDDYIKSFDKKNRKGETTKSAREELFNIEINNEEYTTNTEYTEKEFKKASRKFGLQKEKRAMAYELYKTIKSENTLLIGAISEPTAERMTYPGIDEVPPNDKFCSDFIPDWKVRTRAGLGEIDIVFLNKDRVDAILSQGIEINNSRKGINWNLYENPSSKNVLLLYRPQISNESFDKALRSFNLDERE